MDPKFALAAAYLTLNIPFGANSPAPSMDFGLFPSMQVGTETAIGAPSGPNFTGFASPFGYAHTEDANRLIHQEELGHIDQMEALGPAFWLAYALTNGEPFEPYRVREGDYSTDLSRMWAPDDTQKRQFPQARLTFGEDPTLQILPGYEEALRALWGLITDAE